MTVDNSSWVRIGNGGNKSASSGPSMAPTVLRGCWDVEMVVVRRRRAGFGWRDRKGLKGTDLGRALGTPVGYSRLSIRCLCLWLMGKKWSQTRIRGTWVLGKRPEQGCQSLRVNGN